MADCTIEGVDELVHLLAKLRQIPVAKVLRNVAKDFVQAGYMDTPKSQATGKNSFALLPGRGTSHKTGKSLEGKSVKVNLDDYKTEVNARKHRNFSKPRPKSRHLSMLEAYRLGRPRRGFALSVWIPTMQELGFKKKGPPGAAKLEQVQKGFTLFAKSAGGYADSFRAEIEAYRKSKQTDQTLSQATLSGTDTHPVITISAHEPSLDRFPNWEGHIRQAGLALAGARLIRGLQKCIASKDPSKAPDSNL